MHSQEGTCAELKAWQRKFCKTQQRCVCTHIYERALDQDAHTLDMYAFTFEATRRMCAYFGQCVCTSANP